jgi:hypothetical protein
MAGGLPFEIVLLDDSLKAFAFGLSNHVHKLPYLEDGEGDVADLVRGRGRVRKAKLANKFLRRAR